MRFGCHGGTQCSSFRHAASGENLDVLAAYVAAGGSVPDPAALAGLRTARLSLCRRLSWRARRDSNPATFCLGSRDLVSVVACAWRGERNSRSYRVVIGTGWKPSGKPHVLPDLQLEG